MKKLLITGFEPFGGETINPSWEAVSRLPSAIGGYALTRLRIPVVFGEAAARAIAAADEICPDVILCIGQAGGRAAITPELVGINLRHASIPDNGGYQPQDEPIIPGGDLAYFSTVPVRAMAAAIKEAGIPAAVSYSAGAYVCNDLLYTLLAHYKGTGTRVGFIHIPYSAEQNRTPSMEMEQLIGGLTAAIEHLD
ncbi:MAG: pyroglutamyl-peptidase I [Clostridia bacterium]|nr:pyroglutamyl-peptidase I [Clostridia bacterium]